MDAPFTIIPAQPKNIFSANGRISRMTYFAWMFLLNLIGPSIVCIMLFLSYLCSALSIEPTGSIEISPNLTIFFIILLVTTVIISLYFSFIFTIRRLHDRGQSGWASLLMCVPIANFIFPFYVYFAKGNEGLNQFGVQRLTKTWEKVVAWIGVVFSIIALVLCIIYSQPSNQLEQLKNAEISQLK